MPIGNPIQKNNDTRIVSATATTGQTDFTPTGGYTLNAIGVFRNGVRLNNSTDFTAADGSTVSLNVACDAGDTVTFHIFDKFTVGNAIVGAASTQTVYGNLAVNGNLYSTNFTPTNLNVSGIGTIAKAIIGTGVTIDQSNIDTVGLISATTFTGNLTGDVTGDVTGAASQITVTDQSGDTTCFPVFAQGATGNITPHTGTNLTFNSNTGALTATSVAGNIVGGTVSGTTGTFTGDVDIADKIVHTGDTNTAIRFPAADTFTVETAGDERLRITSTGHIVTQSLTSYSFNNDSSNAKILEVTGDGTVGEYGVINISGNQDADNNKVGVLRFVNRQNSNSSSADDAASKQIASIQSVIDTSDTNAGDDSGGFLSFYTKPESGVNTERLRIDPSGRILLGTTTEGYSSGDDLTVATSGHTGITIRSGTSNEGAIFFSDGTSGDAEYRGFIQYKHASDALILATGAADRLLITSDGRVLVGGHSSASIAAPGGIEALTTAAGNIGGARFVASALGSDLTLAKSRNATVGSHTIVQDDDNIGTIKFRGSDGGEWVDAATIKGEVDGTPGDDDMPGRLIFSTTADGASSSTEAMRITANGDIGINADTPRTITGYKGITINHATHGGFVQFQDNGTNTSSVLGGPNSLDITTQTAISIKFSTQDVERLRVTPAGALQFSDTNSPNDQNTDVWVADDVLQFNAFGTNGAFIFKGGASSTERLKITSKGDVGINTITPWNAHWGNEGDPTFLHVRGDTYGVLSLSGDNGSYTKWSMGAGDGRFYMAYNENDTVHVLDAVRTTRDVEVLVGNLVVKAANKGIDFAGGGSVGTAANILDDYEEGSFSPAWKGESTHGTTSYSTNDAHYTRVGNIVTCRGYSQITGNSGGAGYWFVENLPFTSPNDLGSITTGSCMMEANFNNNALWMVPYKNANSSQLALYYTVDNGSWNRFGLSDDTVWNIIWSITYEVA